MTEAIKIRANEVRDALLAVRRALAEEDNKSGARACEVLASVPDDAVLAMLGRLIR